MTQNNNISNVGTELFTMDAAQSERVSAPLSIAAMPKSAAMTFSSFSSQCSGAKRPPPSSQEPQDQYAVSNSSEKLKSGVNTVLSSTVALNNNFNVGGGIPRYDSNGNELLTPLNREGKNLSEKKIRRLEKNRLSARNCRRKKKEVTQTLQKEINILEEENLRLRLQLKVCLYNMKSAQKSIYLISNLQHHGSRK